MQGQLNSSDGRVERLETTVGSLTSEVTSLKLEFATLVSALWERSFQPTLAPAAAPPKKSEPPSGASITQAAIVVLLATGLLSWQLITTPVSLMQSEGGRAPRLVESDCYRRWTHVVTLPSERVTRVSVDLEPLEPGVEP